MWLAATPSVHHMTFDEPRVEPRGTIIHLQARPFFRLEGARTLRLLDVLSNAGWLQTAPPPTPESPPGVAQVLA